VCAVLIGAVVRALVAALRRELPAAEAARDDAGLGPWVEAAVRAVEGRPARAAVPLDLRGTEFQRRVWRALAAIPRGETRTYSELAAALGAPRSARAVGSACARNPVAPIVPCHRVVREDGGLGGYRWGIAMKERLLRAERRGK
jgi:AraC family transcriptional regulator of adaptative response/methylated-DNA-[protein]-cysteine methyltransferase